MDDHSESAAEPPLPRLSAANPTQGYVLSLSQPIRIMQAAGMAYLITRV